MTKTNTGMSKMFDLDEDKKKVPYTTPDGFFDQLEASVWQEVKDGFLDDRPNDAGEHAALQAKPSSRKASKWRVFVGSALAVAASLAVLFIVNLKAGQHDTYTANDVDRAFSQLSTDDQTFLLSVYQNDIFISE